MIAPRAWIVALVGIAAFTTGMNACKPVVPLTITSPENGSFHALGIPQPGPALTVTGKFRYGQVDSASAEVKVFVNEISGNGHPATVTPGNPPTFSVTVPVDHRAPNAEAEPYLNTLIAVLTDPGSTFQRRAFTTVVVGVDSGVQYGPDADPGLSLRLSQSGLDRVATIVQPDVTATLDLSTLVGSSFGGLCFPEIDPGQDCVTEGGIPIDVVVDAVTHANAEVAITPLEAAGGDPAQARFRIELPGVEVDFHLSDATVPPLLYCSGTVSIDPLRVDAFLDQSPSGGQIEVTQTALELALVGFTVDFSAGSLCGYPTFETYLVDNFGGDFEASALAAVEQALDPAGGTPVIAEAVEQQINGLGIAQALEPTLLMDLGATITAIDEDADGIRYQVETAAAPTDTLCDQGVLTFAGACPDLGTDRWRVPVVPGLPLWGVLSPAALPYDIGLGLGESFMNQLLAGFAATGGLSGEATEDPSCDDGSPGGSPTLTAGCLFGDPLPPQLANDLVASDPLVIRYRPTVAPILPGGEGPLGSQAKLQLAAMIIELREVVGSGSELLIQGIVRLNGGLTLVSDDPYAGGVSYPPGFVPVTKLEFDVETCTGVGSCLPDASFIATEVNLDLPLANIVAALALVDLFVAGGGFLEDVILPQLTQAVAAFTLPTFLGHGLQPVESVREQEFLSLFFDLRPADTGNGTN